MISEEEKSKYQVPSLERALKIIELLANNPGNATKAEIARRLGYPNNSVFRIVSTLEESGYLVRNEENSEYTLSCKFLSLGYHALIDQNLATLSGDVLRRLRDETRETALLGTLLDGEGVVLEQELSPEPIKFLVTPGARFQLHSAAPGKVLLAFLDETARERQWMRMAFTRFNANTITNPIVLRRELAAIRKQGYAIDREEETEGIICIGAPVFDYRRTPRAAIWVTGPKFRLQEDRLAAIGEIVKRHADGLSLRLGGERR